MEMNHVHLAGPDVEALVGFYEEWFGFRKLADHGEGAFLRDDKGFLLAFGPLDGPPDYPGWFHIGFRLDDAQAVRDLHARMERAGVPIHRDLVESEGEAAAFYCQDPAGTKIEVSWHSADE